MGGHADRPRSESDGQCSHHFAARVLAGCGADGGGDEVAGRSSGLRKRSDRCSSCCTEARRRVLSNAVGDWCPALDREMTAPPRAEPFPAVPAVERERVRATTPSGEHVPRRDGARSARTGGPRSGLIVSRTLCPAVGCSAAACGAASCRAVLRPRPLGSDRRATRSSELSVSPLPPTVVLGVCDVARRSATRDGDVGAPPEVGLRKVCGGSRGRRAEGVVRPRRGFP